MTEKTERKEQFTEVEMLQLARVAHWNGNMGPRRVRISSSCEYIGIIDLGKTLGKINIWVSTGDMAFQERECRLKVSLKIKNSDITLDERVMTGKEDSLGKVFGKNYCLVEKVCNEADSFSRSTGFNSRVKIDAIKKAVRIAKAKRKADHNTTYLVRPMPQPEDAGRGLYSELTESFIAAGHFGEPRTQKEMEDIVRKLEIYEDIEFAKSKIPAGAQRDDLYITIKEGSLNERPNGLLKQMGYALKAVGKQEVKGI
ncbi:MAG: hypothetical protein KKD18_05810 [Nanoarchaeota archaeon]|nr:hypothetical protein [Nanoarchaeota archaeon]MBU0977906.1 hypothetical protein [Nanoarchaeota archaeon]